MKLKKTLLILLIISGIYISGYFAYSQNESYCNQFSGEDASQTVEGPEKNCIEAGCKAIKKSAINFDKDVQKKNPDTKLENGAVISDNVPVMDTGGFYIECGSKFKLGQN